MFDPWPCYKLTLNNTSCLFILRNHITVENRIYREEFPGKKSVKLTKFIPRDSFNSSLYIIFSMPTAHEKVRKHFIFNTKKLKKKK